MIKAKHWFPIWDRHGVMRLVCTALHPQRDREKVLTTSQIQDASGRYVTTKSHTYELGRVHPHYRKWLESQGEYYSRAQPLNEGAVPSIYITQDWLSWSWSQLED